MLMLTGVLFPAFGMVGLLLVARLEDRLSTRLHRHLGRPKATPVTLAPAPAAALDVALPVGHPAVASPASA